MRRAITSDAGRGTFTLALKSNCKMRWIMGPRGGAGPFFWPDEIIPALSSAIPATSCAIRATSCVIPATPQMDGLWTLIVGNRQGATQFEVLTAPIGSNTWTSRGKFTGHSTQLTENITDDKPLQLQTRVRLLKNNEYSGQPSEISIVTINP